MVAWRDKKCNCYGQTTNRRPNSPTPPRRTQPVRRAGWHVQDRCDHQCDLSIPRLCRDCAVESTGKRTGTTIEKIEYFDRILFKHRGGESVKKCDCDLVFIHGTGVREPAYSKVFSIISQKLKERNENLCFHKCYWGGALGTTLNAGGLSIPVSDQKKAGSSVIVMQIINLK